MSTPRSSRKQQPKAMVAGGQATSTVRGHANQITIFNEFLAYIATEDEDLSRRWGADWSQVPEHELAQQEIWGYMATYLVEVYVIPAGSKNAGQHPDIGTAHGYWGGLIDQARTRTSSSEAPAVKVCALHTCA